MNKRTALNIRTARRKLYANTVPAELRAVAAMMTLFSGGPAPSPKTASRMKRAYTSRDITMAIESMLKRDRVNEDLIAQGLEPVPAINWGKILMINSRKYALVGRVDIDDFVGELLSDLIAGERGRGVRNTGPWRNNVVGEIKAWAESGFTKSRMEATFAKFIKNKAYNMLRTEQLRVSPDAGFDTGRQDEGDTAGSRGRIFENMFTMDGVTRDMMGMWTSLTRRNPVLTDLIRKIAKKLSQRDDDYGVIFQAYMQDPGVSPAELLEITVEGVDPLTGRRGKMPLSQALGFENSNDPAVLNTNRGKLNYKIKQLRKLLKSMYPEIESVLRDLQMR